ncbi:alpha/beta fold hydrolase [Moorella sp. ACPs]|uniref:alpha/beta fold hydrolase n=1 Tax=Neomoorella carbonis TaxID=3062783 RepID=UPI003254C44B
MLTEVNGIKLYYEDMGAGPALVFIHGLGENADSWENQITLFKKTFRTIAMDLRGHHRSENGNEFITMALFASDILALLDQLGIQKAHFVGHSMGGLICQEIAAHNQERMLSITLSDATSFYPEPMATTGLEERLKRIDTLPMTEVGAAIARAACRPDIDAETLAKVTAMFQLNRPVPYRQATISTLKADYRQYLSQIKVPTLILVGEKDATTPLDYAQLLNKEIKGSKLQIIPEAAHMTKIENPKAYNLALAEFLAPYEPDAALPLIANLRGDE